MVKVVLDAFGGDNAPMCTVDGALEAIAMEENLHVVMVGDEDKLKELLKGRKYNK